MFTLDQIQTILKVLLPEACIGEDPEGQVVIYTNLTLHGDGQTLVSMGE